MGVPTFGNQKVEFVLADGKSLAELEVAHGVKQADVVDALIEETCWGTDTTVLQPFRGKRGTDTDRLAAVRNALATQPY